MTALNADFSALDQLQHRKKYEFVLGAVVNDSEFAWAVRLSK
jgi:hypothetical protein